MTRREEINAKLTDAFKPFHLEVVDESSNHNVPEGSESHFKVLLVTPQFVIETRAGQLDAMVTCWIALGVYGFLRHLLLGPDLRWLYVGFAACGFGLSLIHISEPTRLLRRSRMPSSA